MELATTTETAGARKTTTAREVDDDVLKDPLLNPPDAKVKAGTPGQPSVRVIGSAGQFDLAHERSRDGEWAAGDFTDRLTDMMEEGVPLDDALDALAFGQVSEDENSQFATQFKVGDARVDQQKGAKRALIIGNGDYDQEALEKRGLGAGDLRAVLDAPAMAMALGSQGFTIDDMLLNANSTDMAKAIATLIQDPALKPGDCVVIHYSGHGTAQGLLGVDGGTVDNSLLSSVSSAAQARGLHLRIIVDACHAGSAVAKAQQDQRVLEKKAAKVSGDTKRVQQLDELKKLELWRNGLETEVAAAARAWLGPRAGMFQGLYDDHVAVKNSPYGDDNHDNAVQAARAAPQAVTAWWKETGYVEFSLLLMAFDDANDGIFFKLPNPGAEVSFDQLSAALDQVIEQVRAKLGTKSTDFLRKGWAATSK